MNKLNEVLALLIVVYTLLFIVAASYWHIKSINKISRCLRHLEADLETIRERRDDVA